MTNENENTLWRDTSPKLIHTNLHLIRTRETVGKQEEEEGLLHFPFVTRYA